MAIRFQSGFAIDSDTGRVVIRATDPEHWMQGRGQAADGTSGGGTGIVSSSNAGAFDADARLVTIVLAGATMPADARWLGGIARDDSGALIVDTVDPVVATRNGLPFVESGALAATLV